VILAVCCWLASDMRLGPCGCMSTRVNVALCCLIRAEGAGMHHIYKVRDRMRGCADGRLCCGNALLCACVVFCSLYCQQVSDSALFTISTVHTQEHIVQAIGCVRIRVLHWQLQHHSLMVATLLEWLHLLMTLLHLHTEDGT
jgi:hypothetical protein